MAGLMKPGKDKAPEQQQVAGESNVSEEEQAQYNEFVGNGMNLIYDEGGLEQIVSSLEGDGSPIEGLANTLVGVVSRLEDSAEESGQKFSGDVVYHGGVELLEQMVDMSEKAGIHKFSEEDMQTALYMALDQYRQMRQEQGKLPEEQLKSDFQSILQAENSGSLDEVLPGVSDYAAQVQG